MFVVPATVGSINRRIVVKASPRQKSKTPIPKIIRAAGHGCLIPVILAAQEAEIRRIMV
jgi:hypothetical protein